MGKDGTRECVVVAVLGKRSLVLFVRGGERLEISRTRALAASLGPGVVVLQVSPRQRDGPDFPPPEHNLRLAEGEEKGALLVGVAPPPSKTDVPIPRDPFFQQGSAICTPKGRAG